MQFIVSGSISFLPPYTQVEKKNIWSELELRTGSLASEVTALTARPWLLRLVLSLNDSIKFSAADHVIAREPPHQTANSSYLVSSL